LFDVVHETWGIGIREDCAVDGRTHGTTNQTNCRKNPGGDATVELLSDMKET
jgi:hypothetical protein